MNTYANEKSAKAAARKQGLDLATLTFTTDAEGRVSFAATPAPKARKTKPAQFVQNGVPAPREGTVGHKLWALCDEIATTVNGGYKAIRLAVIQAAGDAYNPGNVRTEISLWRKHNGIPKVAPAAE